MRVFSDRGGLDTWYQELGEFTLISGKPENKVKGLEWAIAGLIN